MAWNTFQNKSCKTLLPSISKGYPTLREFTRDFTRGQAREGKNQGFNGIGTRDLCDTGAMLYHLNQAWSFFQLLILKNILRWSFCTFIFIRSSHVNYFIYFSHHFTPHGKIWTQLIDLVLNVLLHSSVGRASHAGDHASKTRDIESVVSKSSLDNFVPRFFSSMRPWRRRYWGNRSVNRLLKKKQKLATKSWITCVICSMFKNSNYKNPNYTSVNYLFTIVL